MKRISMSYRERQMLILILNREIAEIEGLIDEFSYPDGLKRLAEIRKADLKDLIKRLGGNQ